MKAAAPGRPKSSTDGALRRHQGRTQQTQAGAGCLSGAAQKVFFVHMCALCYPSAMSTTAPAAFLSVRLPETTRDRLKAEAAARGETVQSLVGGLVERFLADQAQTPPSLGAVMTQLRAQAPRLKERGITALWVFGSVARGDAHPGSDIDLMADIDPAKPLSLVGVASLRAELSGLLGAEADLVERAILRPAVLETADRDAVRVL